MNITKKIKETYNSNLKKEFDSEFLAYRYLYRPLSFPLTVGFIYVGLSANMVTLLNFFVLIASVVCFLFGNFVLSVIGAALFFMFYILDFVDGNVARFHGLTNYFGKFIDGLLDTAGFFILIFIAVNNVNTGGSFFSGNIEIYISLASVYSILFVQYFNMRLAYLSLEKGSDYNNDVKREELKQKRNRNKLVQVTNSIYKNSIVLMPVALLITTVFEINSVLIMYYFVIHVVFGSGYLFMSLLRSKVSLNNYRAY